MTKSEKKARTQALRLRSGGYRGVRTRPWCDDVLSEPGAVRCWPQDPVVRE